MSFSLGASKQIEKTKNHVVIGDEPGRDDLLFITSIPWVSFTSIAHPINMNSVDRNSKNYMGKIF